MELSQLAMPSDVKVNDNDTLGGSFLTETGAYKATIDHAHISKSKGGALALNVGVTTDTGIKVNEAIYFTNREGKVFYTRDGENHSLPGYNKVNALTNVVLGKNIDELSTEEKVIKIYSFEAGGETPTKVNMITDLVGQSIIVGVKKVKENKKEESNGKWVNKSDGSFREYNTYDKFFRASDGKTNNEIKAGVELAEFLPKWKEKNDGTILDKYEPVSGGAASTKNASSTPATAPLFE